MLKVIRFTAPWCQPCKLLKPIIEDLERENPNVKFEAINIEDGSGAQLASKYGVMSIPTLIFFNDGLPFDKLTGFKPKATIQASINSIK